MSITSDASVEINAPVDKVWQAVTNPAMVKEWFFGAIVESDWKAGSPIIFRGEWNGQLYEDKGVIQKIEANKLLEYTHLSSRTGQADISENYEIVQFTLSEDEGKTTLTIHEDNLPSTEARNKSRDLWKVVLEKLKNVVEG